MDLVGSIDDPQDARVGGQLREDEVLGDAGRAERLDGLVDNPARELGRDHLDRRDLDLRASVADRVHQPRRLHHQQPRLLDPHPGVGDPLPHDALIDDRASEGGALAGAFDQHL